MSLLTEFVGMAHTLQLRTSFNCWMRFSACCARCKESSTFFRPARTSSGVGGQESSFSTATVSLGWIGTFRRISQAASQSMLLPYSPKHFSALGGVPPFALYVAGWLQHSCDLCVQSPVCQDRNIHYWTMLSQHYLRQATNSVSAPDRAPEQSRQQLPQVLTTPSAPECDRPFASHWEGWLSHFQAPDVRLSVYLNKFPVQKSTHRGQFRGAKRS